VRLLQVLSVYVRKCQDVMLCQIKSGYVRLFQVMPGYDKLCLVRSRNIRKFVLFQLISG